MRKLSVTMQVGLTILVYTIFMVDSTLLLTRALPDGVHDIAKDMLSGLLVLVTGATNFWMLSTHSSQQKDETIRSFGDALANSTPGVPQEKPPGSTL